MASVPPVRHPEVAAGLRMLLRSLPPVVRNVVFSSTLQRTGCLKCGIGPHHVYECPHLSREEAVDLEQKIFRRWVVLVGEELMLYGSSSSTTAYTEGAIARMASRKDLPRRPPRHMKNEATAAESSGHPDSPLLPLPIQRPPMSSSAAPVLPASPSRAQLSAIPQQPQGSMQGTPNEIAKPKPKPKPSSQQQMLSDKAPSNVFSVLSKRKETAAVSSAAAATSSAVSNVAISSSFSTPTNTRNVSKSSEHVDCVDHQSTEEWDDDNVILDNISKLAKQVTQVVGDLEMIKARMLGNRRSRPFTPGSSARPAKVAREAAVQDNGQVLDFQAGSTQEILAGLSTDVVAVESQDLQELDSQSEQGGDPQYDEWDLARYKRAKTVRARGLFWEKASKESKERMVQELLREEPMAAATVQARQMKWIPF